MNEIRFRIPQVPPSMNSLYNVMFALRRVEMKPDVRRYKSAMKMYVPPYKKKEDVTMQLTLNFHMPMFFKNGNLRKIDESNLTKLIKDLICEKIGFDDCWVKKTTSTHIHSEKLEFVECVLSEWKTLDEHKKENERSLA